MKEKSKNEYLIDIRIQHAMELLCQSDIPVSEIAYQVGFSDTNYFYRLFRRKVDATPIAYRLTNTTSE